MVYSCLHQSYLKIKRQVRRHLTSLKLWCNEYFLYRYNVSDGPEQGRKAMVRRMTVSSMLIAVLLIFGFLTPCLGQSRKAGGGFSVPREQVLRDLNLVTG